MSAEQSSDKPDLTSIELEDIQGLILRGYNLPYIRYYILKITDAEKARNFCGALASQDTDLHITTAAPWKIPPGEIRAAKPEYCLNLGITIDGLKILLKEDTFLKENAPCETLNKYSRQLFDVFYKGATDKANLKLIGDTGKSAPEFWWNRDGDGWIQPTQPESEEDKKNALPKSDGSDLHLQITLYTGEKNREIYHCKLITMINADKNNGVEIVFSQDSQPVYKDKGENYIHFGYRDSISQPRVAGIDTSSSDKPNDDRPFVPLSQFAISNDGDYAAHLFLVNGSFAAFRLLYQDVEKFESFINQNKESIDPNLVAAKMVGRWFNGTPLIVSPREPSTTLPQDLNYFNNFNYLEASDNQRGVRLNDESGLLCPYAAHTRRVNPRDDDKVKGNEDIEDDKQYAVKHRIMRRATAYGPDYTPETKNTNRGLVGLFIGANLSNQFQFVMSQWVSQGSFRSIDTPNQSGIDPIFGPQESVLPDMANPDHKYLQYPTGTKDNLQNQNICGMSRFIRTDGSLYLFLPSITALKLISRGLIAEPSSTQ